MKLSNMVKVLFTAFAVIALLGSCNAKKAETSIETKIDKKELTRFTKKQRPIIAILPFTNNSKLLDEYKGAADKIPLRLISELYPYKRFRIIERFRLNDLLKEISLGQTGLIETSRAVSVGKQLGAEMILLGVVTSANVEKEKMTVGVAYIDSVEITVALDARLINVATGEVEVIASAMGTELRKKHVAMGATMDASLDVGNAIDVAIKGAVKMLAYKLAREIEPKQD